MKICRVCGETKPLDAFSMKSVQRGTRQTVCRSCSLAYHQDWINRPGKREQRSARRRARRDNLYAIAMSYLSAHPCVDCGESNPVVLDFDHVRGKKSADVSYLVREKVAEQRLLDEIAKCEVRCRNCHAIATYRRCGARRMAWMPDAVEAVC